MFRFTYEIAPLVGGPLMVTVIAAGLKEADAKVYSVLGGTPRDELGKPAQVRLTSIVECEGEADTPREAYLEACKREAKSPF